MIAYARTAAQQQIVSVFGKDGVVVVEEKGGFELQMFGCLIAQGRGGIEVVADLPAAKIDNICPDRCDQGKFLEFFDYRGGEVEQVEIVSFGGV